MGAVTRVFSRRWWWVTVLVLLGMVGLVRLGFWQLDRMHQKQAFNTMLSERWREQPYDLTAKPLPPDRTQFEYRRVEASGRFDYDRQIVLKNQFANDAPGVYLVTPLLLSDDRAVLVARGWLPLDQASPEQWGQYEEVAGAPVIGLIQESQTITGAEPPATAQSEWFRIDIAAIQRQMPYQLDPIYVLQLPEEGRAYDKLPIREEPAPLDEGNHFSYAIQWFTFALILGFGYIQLIRYTESRERRGLGQSGDDVADVASGSGTAIS